MTEGFMSVFAPLGKYAGAALSKGAECRAMHDMNEKGQLLVSAHLVDARGKACPAPIIELAKALRVHEVVELWADDPAAWGIEMRLL